MNWAWRTHSEDPCGWWHFAITSWRIGHDAEVVAFAPRQTSDVGLQLASERHQRVVGLWHILITLPDANFIAGERLLVDTRSDVPPRDPHCGRIDSDDVDGGRRFQWRFLEGTFQETFTLRSFACVVQSNALLQIPLPLSLNFFSDYLGFFKSSVTWQNYMLWLLSVDKSYQRISQESCLEQRKSFGALIET